MMLGLVLISSVLAMITAVISAFVVGFTVTSFISVYALTGVSMIMGLSVSRFVLCPLVSRITRFEPREETNQQHG